MALHRDRTLIWGQPEPALSLDDFAVEVDARLLAGPLDSNFGLLIRHDGAISPLQVYLTCFRVLEAHHDPRAWRLPNMADELLQARAAKISRNK